MCARFSFEYDLPAEAEAVYRYFLEIENISTAWPPEIEMRYISREDDVYVVGFKLLGQRYTARFRIEELGGFRMYHETVDFPFGKLRHWITVEPREGGGSKLEEVLELRSWNPFAGNILRRILEYRRQAIMHAFGVSEPPAYRDPFKIGVAVGNLLCLVGSVAGVVLPAVTPPPLPGARFVLGLVSFFLLWFFTHDLAHYIVGRLVGIRFSNYYIGLSNIVRLNILPKPFKNLPIALGIKIDRLRSKASPRGYAVMYAAGPIASMLAPLYVPATILSNSPGSLAGLLLLILALANTVFTSIFSPRAGCLGKASKALRRRRLQ
ncbi:hypothetical protein HRbin01_00720 [archaeon HR01]|nr:hypothetical protein HRbin01_00720 [archaeon HR01]